jgi:hypothetical protein
VRLMSSVLILGAVFLSGAAMAQTAAERAACQADYQKYCSGVLPGGGRIMECLAKELDKLTPECKAAVEAHIPK